jgi:hypothetical protein
MKNKVNNREELTRAIAELELRASVQKKEIQDTYAVVSENIRPANLVKNGVRSVFSGKYNDEMLNILIGMGSGMLSKKLFFGRARGFLGKTAGTALEWGMAALVSNNAEKIKEGGSKLIDRIFRKNKTESNHIPIPGQE